MLRQQFYSTYYENLSENGEERIYKRETRKEVETDENGKEQIKKYGSIAYSGNNTEDYKEKRGNIWITKDENNIEENITTLSNLSDEEIEYLLNDETIDDIVKPYLIHEKQYRNNLLENGGE